MHAERTPNPNSIKWVVGRAIVPPGVSAHFEAAPAPAVSPLAAGLFRIDGVVGVFLASDFATVTKREDVEWSDIAEEIVETLQTQLSGEQPALGPDFQAEGRGEESGVAVRIQRILDEEVRPAVAMDGGDIVFAGFRDGIVELYLQGSCSGCPSSTATLKHGIESRLREAIPEVRGVVALSS